MDSFEPVATPGRWRPEFEPPEPEPQPEPETNPVPQEEEQRRRRRYGTRKCRICLDEVEPTFETPGFMRGNGKPKYVSDDPELGRLMSPCMCKGSQKYVHEGCLEAWRHASRNHSERNMWKCPTCGFQYRMDRLSVGKLLGHWATNLVLTLLVVVLVTFFLGFVGDKILDFYLDPYGFLFEWRTVDEPQVKYYRTKEEMEFDLAMKKLEQTWGFHFIKGFFSLGVIGFLKAALASPFYYFNLGGGRRRRGDGRDRYLDLSWTVIIIGTLTFVWAVWKFVRYQTKRVLDTFKENIVDVQADDDDEVEETDVNEPSGTAGDSNSNANEGEPTESRKDQ
ncbi:RING finger domain containing protein [Zalerion maritima]|uniref:RING finger domain containing protein n=1 Tax=Zalerion maritima TaxID=339359 RepID=A0AAD5RIY5_9PEZI|nr:RING finger domain containing protein [Zalerion maritima]